MPGWMITHGEIGVCTQAPLAVQLSAGQELPSSHCASFVHWYVMSRHQSEMVRVSWAASSTPKRRHVPFGSVPEYTASVFAYTGAGAGRGKVSVVSTLLGLKVPLTSGPASGMVAAAASSSVTLTPETSPSP